MLERILFGLSKRCIEIMTAFLMGTIMVFIVTQLLVPSEKIPRLTVVLLITGTCVACLVYARIWNFLFLNRDFMSFKKLS